MFHSTKNERGKIRPSYSEKAKILTFFQPHFRDIYVVNVGGISNVLYSKDAKFNVDFKNDNILQQNVNRTEDIWLFVRRCKDLSLSLQPCREDKKCFYLKSKLKKPILANRTIF